MTRDQYLKHFSIQACFLPFSKAVAGVKILCRKKRKKAHNRPLHWEDVLSVGKTKIDCRLRDPEPTMHTEGLLPRDHVSPGLPPSNMQSVLWTPAKAWHMKTLHGPLQFRVSLKQSHHRYIISDILTVHFISSILLPSKMKEHSLQHLVSIKHGFSSNTWYKPKTKAQYYVLC